MGAILVFAFFFVCFSSAADQQFEVGLEQTKREIRQFVLLNYRPLSLDIVAGGGEYLSALEGLMGSDCIQSVLFFSQLERQLVSISYIPDFARAAANLYSEELEACGG